MKLNIVIDEYMAMIQALAKKFNINQIDIEAMPEVIQIKERCLYLDQHIDYLIRSGCIDGEGESGE